MTIIEFPLKNRAAKPAFEDLYEEYYQPLLHYLYKKTGNMQDAEDLTSETFLYCYRSYDQYDPEKSAVSTWVYLVANSRLKNHYRDKREHVEISELENLLPAGETDMERAAYLEQLRSFLAERLANLPERQQQVIALRFFQEKDYAEIAEELGISAGNARVILSRALDRLKLDMADVEEDWRV